MSMGHSFDVRAQLSMARDCLKRAEDGIESESWNYVADQLQKARTRISEAQWRADLLDVLARTGRDPRFGFPEVDGGQR